MHLTGLVRCDCEDSPIAIIYIRNVCKSVYNLIISFKLKDLLMFLLPLINPLLLVVDFIH